MPVRIAALISPQREVDARRTRTPRSRRRPAASPSSPSRKLTMFITATIPTIVTAMPTDFGSVHGAEEREGEAVHPDAEPGDNRRRERSGRRASPTSAGRGSRRSRRPWSRRRRRAGSPRIWLSRRRNASDGTKMPRKSARPPSRGTPCSSCAAAALGRSTTPSSRAMPPTAGVSSTTIAERDQRRPDDLRWSVSWCPDH